MSDRYRLPVVGRPDRDGTCIVHAPWSVRLQYFVDCILSQLCSARAYDTRQYCVSRYEDTRHATRARHVANGCVNFYKLHIPKEEADRW